MLAFLNLHGCKKEEKAPADLLEGEWFLKTTYNGTTFYLHNKPRVLIPEWDQGLVLNQKSKL